MRLLVIVPAYESPRDLGGGVACSLRTLCRALVKLGVSVSVYTLNASSTDIPVNVPLEQPVDLGGVKVYYFRSTFGPRSQFDSRRLVEYLRATVDSFDVVYVAAVFMWIGIAAAKICREHSVPMIFAIHGGFTRVTRRKSYLKKRLFYSLFVKRALLGAAALYLTSHTERRNSQDWLCGRPEIIIPNCVDPDQFYPCPDARRSFRYQHGIPEAARVLISVTRFDWMKRVDLLMAAVTKSPNWYLVLVGDDQSGLGPRLKRDAKALGIEGRVICTGYLKGLSLCEALSAGDWFALVSESENFGNVVIEAMMCGLPVLISQEVGAYEYICEQPFVVATGISEAAVTGALGIIERRLLDLEVDHMRIRQFAIDHFAPSSVAQSFVTEVDKLLIS